MSVGWAQGYVADVEYHDGFYGELAPDHLDLVCRLNGVQPPDRINGFAYCELGSGQGLTTTVLAAANPEGRFVAVDFNPAQVARARARATQAGLTNLEVLEASFEDLAEDCASLPAFDYITLHGVYSWISEPLRAAIVRLIAQTLKPGGVVYVSYNAMPGWTAALPIQHLLAAYAAEARGRSDARANAALGEIAKVAEAGSIYLQDNPFLDRIGKTRDAGDLTYLAHEYLNANWEPLYHADVVRDLAAAKLEFVGSGALLQNFPALMLTEAQRTIRESAEDPVLRETLKDYFTTRSFRSDVFVRGRRALTSDQRDQHLAALPLRLVSPRSEAVLEMATPVGKVEPRAAVYGPMLDALVSGARTVEDLRALPEVRAQGQPSVPEIAGLLVASGHVVPAKEGAPATNAAVRLNRVLAAHSLHADSNRPGVLAASALGTGIPCSTLEQNVLAHLQLVGERDAREVAEAIWAPIKARGEALVQDGEPVAGDDANLAILAERARQVIERKWPIWQAVGALAADRPAPVSPAAAPAAAAEGHAS